MDLSREQWDRYVPNVGENRTLHATGQPGAVSVLLRPPTARTWRRWWDHVTKDTELLARMVRLERELGQERAAAAITAQSLFHDGLTEILWLPCVGALEGLTVDGQAVKDGAELWALRDEIGDAELYQDIVLALISRSHLTDGLVRFLAPASPPSTFLSSNGGTVESVAAISGT